MGVRFLRGAGKEWMGCLVNELRAFGIETDQWVIDTQDVDEWCKKLKQGCSIVTEGIKGRVTQSKRSCGALRAIVEHLLFAS